MKIDYKISGRERWVLALAPSLLILAVYFLGIADGLSADFEKQQKRLAAASAPMKPATAPATLAKARQAKDTAAHDIADREAQIAQLEAKIASLPKGGIDRHQSASVIERVETVFARNGVVPLTSEPADDGSAAANAPTALLDVLAPKQANEQAGMRREARVWHCIFDDRTPRFQRALKELGGDAPTVVPLSMNLVYNPANFGETRLLELWLLY